MNIYFVDQHTNFAHTFTPGFYSEIVKHARVLIVFQLPWLKHDASKEHPQQIAENLWIVNRKVIAPYRSILMSDRIAQLDTVLIDRQFRRYSRELGWSPDIVQFTSPHFRKHLKCRTGRKKVFWLVDHYSQVPGLSPYLAGFTTHAERDAVRNADLTITTATELLRLFSPYSKQMRFLPNAADHNLFQPLWMRPVPEPEELRRLKRPIFGFVGNINPVSDWNLLGTFVKEHPHYTFALLGAMNGPSEFYRERTFAETMRLPNVHYLGQVPQEVLPAYIAHFDVGLLLDPLNEFSKTVNHNKVYQYLLSGIPVTGTNSTPDYQPFSELMHLFDDPNDWSHRCEEALAARDEISSRRRRTFAEKMSWKANTSVRMSMYDALLDNREVTSYQFPQVDK